MACGSSKAGSFTFTWTINNVYEHSVFSLDSPMFVADSIDKTKWRLSFYIASWYESTAGHLTCVLQREKDENVPGSIYIDFQISIVDETGVILRSVREDRCRFGMNLGYAGDTSFRVSKNLIQIKTLVENFEKYVWNNTLTLRCRMWKFGCFVPRSELCFARTILDIEKRSFVWTIEQVFFISPGQSRTIHVPSYNKGSSSLFLSLSLKQNCGEEVFSIEMYEVKNLKHLHCKISIINSEGKVFDGGENGISNVTFVNKKCQLFQSFIRKSKLLQDQKRLLTNNTMILQCDFQLIFGIGFNEIENYRVGSSEISVADDLAKATALSLCHSSSSSTAVPCHSSSSTAVPSHSSSSATAVPSHSSSSSTAVPSHSSSSSTAVPCHSSCSSKKVLECLLNEGTLSDITLRAGTKSFPVHKNILSVRSLFFKSMFIKDEMGSINKVVDLPDIDEVTLRSLLLYIYTDTIEDLDFGSALELYQSADKYQLTDLKNACREFLLKKLRRSNIFQVLSFANVYQDNTIKQAAQDFISDLGNEFTSSEEWQNFRKRNLELALETMEYIFSRKRIKTEN